jgi:DNA-binding NarL/FixJ family response regulator
MSGAPDSQADLLEALTTRERQILSMCASGLSNKTIAAELSISEQTVKVHARSIFRKMGVTNRVQAILVYLGQQQ